MTLKEGDQVDSMGNRLKLKSMELDIREIPDLSLLQLKRARRELREILHDGRYPQLPHVRALALLNTEIAVMEDE